MADEQAAVASKDAEVGEPPKKSSKILLVLMGIALLGAGGAAVFFAGPALGLASKEAAQPAAPPPQEKTTALPAAVVSLLPIVVDLKDADDMRYHLKIGMSAETALNVTEVQFRQLEPRGREAAIGYLRQLAYEKATDPAEFDKISDELRTRVLEAIGKDQVDRLLITDFVAQ